MTKLDSYGAFEAKTKFSELLEQVNQGAEIVITRHEKPIARLIPYERLSTRSVEDLFERFADFGARFGMGKGKHKKLSFRELINEGRKR